MMKNDLSELLERVKAATGPDRVLDAAISAHFRYHPYGPFHWLDKSPEAIFAPTHAGWVGFTLPGEDTPRDAWASPEYTASVDAALEFSERVLRGWVVADLCQNSRHAGDPWGCTLAVYFGSTPSKNKSASSGYDFPTASLAIIAATMTALISQEPDHDHQ